MKAEHMRTWRKLVFLPVALIAIVLVSTGAANVLAGGPQPAPEQQANGVVPSAPGPDLAPGQQENDFLLVKFRPGTGPDKIARINHENGAAVVSEIPGLGVHRIKVSPGRAQASAQSYKAIADVEFAEVDSAVQTQFTPNDPYFATAYPTSKFGNMPQWAPQFVSAPAAWDTTMGDPSVVIAVVDTGVDGSHPDLQTKMVTGATLIGGTTKDGFGHGTHVAGIAAASTNNGTGVAGICPRCSIMPVRVLDANGSGWTSDVAAGIVYAADHGARVINMSLGAPTVSQSLRAALDYALAHNALPVAAMGNNYAPYALEPAYWYSALSVGAVDQSGAKTDFSNYGNKTDVVAPGRGILSTMPTYNVTMNSSWGVEQNYDALSGTSMATPVVSGIAGLVISRNPALNAVQVKGIIEASAGDGKTYNETTGFGLVNAARAVNLAASTDRIAPSVNLVSPAAGSTLSKQFLFQAAPADGGGVHHVDFVIDGVRAGDPGTSQGTSANRKLGTPAPDRHRCRVRQRGQLLSAGHSVFDYESVYHRPMDRPYLQPGKGRLQLLHQQPNRPGAACRRPHPSQLELHQGCELHERTLLGEHL
ncbi:MAG: peptidase S8 [Chloroflexi bacterium]|nr:MAG: peptidase S8 [Chloroflexota bacterium]